MTDPAIAFCVVEHERPAFEVRVNFGMFAGRQATPAEIQELARLLADAADELSIVAEERHDFGGAVETSVHQVRIEVPAGAFAGDADERCETVAEAAEEWARACFAERSVDVPGT